MTEINFANSSLEQDLDPAKLAEMKAKIAGHYEGILDALGIDWRSDHNTEDSPQRIAKMYCEEIFSGRFTAPPKLTFFENVKKYDQLICTGPIEVKSTCAHHFCPITGHAYIGVLPNYSTGRIVGLSKYGRVVRWFAQRPQIQEELTSQIADYLQENLEPAGIAVRIVAKHHCVSMRGLNESGSVMDTIIVRGELRDSPNLKLEFLESCKFMHNAATAI